ncbi:hypothetical protein [Desulfospira joergensenii]|uniref:hypothetical protein n=1 Tax=Desulfospira joergensenii TaxID=53329 RepID=UPI0003B6BCAD|nr:hypothetical protein [Desulfospira joergensenii]
MSKKSNSVSSPPQAFVDRKTREEVINAVLGPDSKSITEKKILVIPASRSLKADFEDIAKSMNADPGSIQYRILKLYCEEKRAKVVDVNVLMHRIENWSNEQLKVLELICTSEDFTANDILKFAESLKRFGTSRILTLRAFIDLEGVTPGSLHQFFMISIPQLRPDDLDQEAYEEEVREKMMTSDQVNVFYNICSRIPDIPTKTAIALLPKARQMKQQHAQVMNTFLKESVFFGDKPITSENIVGLVNLWLSLPEIIDTVRFNNLLKRLSRKPDAKKSDFQFLIQSYKEEIERETGKGGGKKGFGLHTFFS